MAYAFTVDGLDPDRRDEIDAMLFATGNGKPDEKAKARREREAVAAAMSQMR